VSERFKARALDRAHAAAIEFYRVRVLQTNERACGHVTDRSGRGGNLRLRKIFDAR